MTEAQLKATLASGFPRGREVAYFLRFRVRGGMADGKEGKAHPGELASRSPEGQANELHWNPENVSSESNPRARTGRGLVFMGAAEAKRKDAAEAARSQGR